jgi:GNAT superfamily N-acetyltransferase
MRVPAAEVTVRPAGAHDAATMRRLARAAFEHYVARMGCEPAPMQGDYAQVVVRGRAWVAECEGHVVGLLVLQPAENYLLVDVLAVAPDVQGLGIGGRLLSLAEAEARSLGLPEVRLCTNEAMTENLSYYPRRGYRETHRTTQDGYRRVFFSKGVEQDGTPHPLP